MVDTIDGRVALTIPQTAFALDCGETSIRNMLRDGKLDRTFIGEDIRVTAASILALLAKEGKE